MFVYVRDWKIILQVKNRYFWSYVNGAREYEFNGGQTDRLIFEENQIKRYEESNQYLEDINYYHLQNENKELKKHNKQLEIIAHEKIQEDPKMFKTDKPNDYQQKIYLLKKMKCSRQSSWQGVESNSQ